MDPPLNQEIDPLTLLTSTFCKWLEDSACMRRAMGLAIKNINAFNKSRTNQTPDVKNESDVPDIRLTPTGGPININFASNVTEMIANYNLEVNSGDPRVSHLLYPVYFAAFATAASGLSNSPITAIKWRDKPFLKKYDFLNSSLGQSNPDLNRGITGWTAVCSLSFRLYFLKSDLDAFVQGV